MYWVQVFLFNLLFFNSCLTAYIDRGLSANYIQQQNNSQNGAPVEEFNEDFTLPIFDLAELEEILQMAKKPESAEFVKNTVFPAKYSGYTFHFLGGPNQDMIVASNIFYISDVNMFVDLITLFGENIKDIGMYYSVRNVNEENLAILKKCINDHCSNSLTFLNLGYIRENSFTYFTNTFPNLKKLHLTIASDQIGSDLLFDEIFPNLEILALDYADYANNIQNNGSRFIESELPPMKHLKDLSIYLEVENSTKVATIKKQLGDMMQKNPQIQKLRFKTDLDDFIYEINEYLPNLEDLEVPALLYSETRPVHFENVKYFKIGTHWSSGNVGNLSFSQIESLDMHYDTIIANGTTLYPWITFFKNHQNLRQLNCTARDQEGLAELFAELPNLDEIRINSYKPFDLALVYSLIESHNNLTKFHYDANRGDESILLEIDSFLEKFKMEWNITYNFEGRPFIKLERKN